jgi:hypothetical protein
MNIKPAAAGSNQLHENLPNRRIGSSRRPGEAALNSDSALRAQLARATVRGAEKPQRQTDRTGHAAPRSGRRRHERTRTTPFSWFAGAVCRGMMTDVKTHRFGRAFARRRLLSQRTPSLSSTSHRQPPTRRPEPLPPLIVERIRAELSQREATLVSMLAYAGLRPEEATSARWRDWGERALHVHASKTERPRTIKLLAPLVQDLAEWRLGSGRPPASALIFPTHDGDEWKLHDWQNWRQRVYQPSAPQKHTPPHPPNPL